jgi:hypothetical protein
VFITEVQEEAVLLPCEVIQSKSVPFDNEPGAAVRAGTCLESRLASHLGVYLVQPQ